MPYEIGQTWSLAEVGKLLKSTLRVRYEDVRLVRQSRMAHDEVAILRVQEEALELGKTTSIIEGGKTCKALVCQCVRRDSRASEPGCQSPDRYRLDHRGPPCGDTRKMIRGIADKQLAPIEVRPNFSKQAFSNAWENMDMFMPVDEVRSMSMVANKTFELPVDLLVDLDTVQTARESETNQCTDSWKSAVWSEAWHASERASRGQIEVEAHAYALTQADEPVRIEGPNLGRH